MIVLQPSLLLTSFLFHSISAGKATTDEELEEMLESGNAAVFTAGVSVCVCVCVYVRAFLTNKKLVSLNIKCDPGTDLHIASDAMRCFFCACLSLPALLCTDCGLWHL